MGQRTEMSPLVSLLFQTFLNPLKFLMEMHSEPFYKGFRTSDSQRNVMGQSTEMSPLDSMLFRTFLKP